MSAQEYQISQTPIADWLSHMKPKSQKDMEPSFNRFLNYWRGLQGPSFPGSPEEVAVKLLERRFADLASPNIAVRFGVDSVATRWFDSEVAKHEQSRYSCETRLGHVMSFFKYYHCRITPQVDFRRERTRKKHNADRGEVNSTIGYLDPKYRIASKIMVQTGARPASIVALDISDVGPYRDTDFGLVHYRISKRGKAWGYPGFLGPEVYTELRAFIGGRISGKIFDFSANTFGNAWLTAVQKAGLDKSSPMNGSGKKQHEFTLYRLRTYNKEFLDEAGLSKDWVNLLHGKKLADEDEAYTPGTRLFNAWQKGVYPKVSFVDQQTVSRNVELQTQMEETRDALRQIGTIITKILGEKGANVLSKSELEWLEKLKT